MKEGERENRRKGRWSREKEEGKMEGGGGGRKEKECNKNIIEDSYLIFLLFFYDRIWFFIFSDFIFIYFYLFIYLFIFFFFFNISVLIRLFSHRSFFFFFIHHSFLYRIFIIHLLSFFHHYQAFLPYSSFILPSSNHLSFILFTKNSQVFVLCKDFFFFPCDFW